MAFLPEPVYSGPESIIYFRDNNVQVWYFTLAIPSFDYDKLTKENPHIFSAILY